MFQLQHPTVVQGVPTRQPPQRELKWFAFRHLPVRGYLHALATTRTIEHNIPHSLHNALQV